MGDNDTAAERRADFIRALTEEREGYVRSGKADRVAQVDKQLAAYGVKPTREQTTRAGKKATSGER